MLNDTVLLTRLKFPLANSQVPAVTKALRRGPKALGTEVVQRRFVCSDTWQPYLGIIAAQANRRWTRSVEPKADSRESGA